MHFRRLFDSKRNLRNYRKQDILSKMSKNRKDCGKIGSREFFANYKKQQRKTFINELYGKYHLPTSNPNEMLETVRYFYSNLYNEKETNTHTRTTFLKEVDCAVSAEHVEILKRTPNDEEIDNVVKSLANGKSPGPDGISAEFYKRCLPIIKTELREVFQYWFEKENIPGEIKKGVITLIHKKGDDADLNNYRPITLFNLDYKIYTKILANRIKELIPSLIDKTQFATAGKNIGEATVLSMTTT